MEYVFKVEIEPVTIYRVNLFKMGKEENATLLSRITLAECDQENKAERLKELFNKEYVTSEVRD